MTDDRQLQELYYTYYKFVYRLASNRLYAYTGSTADVQDIVQEAFLRAVQKDIHNHPNPGGWFAATTNNLCMSHVKTETSRKNKLKQTACTPESNRQAAIHPADAVHDITEQVDTQLTLMNTLSPEEYKIVVDHYIHGRSLADIAGEMGTSYVALRVRLHRIRIKLKNIFLEM